MAAQRDDGESIQEQPPARRVPLYRARCDGAELDHVAEVLAGGWLTSGAKTQQFEREFAALVGARHACAVNSCTAALHLALEAVGVRPGERVFVPTMTFVSSAEAADYVGAEPVLLDVDGQTGLLTGEILTQAIADHSDVKALVVVHYAGRPAKMLADSGRGILDICRANGIRVVEDAAHALPASIDGRMIGAIGDATCFSFYATKPITTGEGGMLTTDDDAVAERVRLMRGHGIDRDAWRRESTSAAKWEYDVVAIGFKYNMADLNAAIGLAQLARCDEFWRGRCRSVEQYYSELADVECLALPPRPDPGERHAWHLFVVNVCDEAPVDRNEVIELLAARGVGASVHFKPLHRMSYYRDHYDLDAGRFPGAEHLWRGCLSLPLYPSMTAEDVDYVCANLKNILM